MSDEVNQNEWKASLNWIFSICHSIIVEDMLFYCLMLQNKQIDGKMCRSLLTSARASKKLEISFYI